jgi:hypothetical protein
MEDITDLKMPYDYFIDKSDSVYRAFNGRTGKLQFSGTNFGTVVNACIDTQPYEISLLFDRGSYSTTSAGPAIDTNGKSVHFKGAGAGINTLWTKWGTMFKAGWTYADYIIKNSNTAVSPRSVIIEDIYFNGDSRPTALGGIQLDNSWFGVIRNCAFSGFIMNVAAHGADAKAITMADTSGAGRGCYYNSIENCNILNCTIGINLGFMANSSQVFGGLIEGASATNAQYGIVADDGDTCAIYGTDIAGFDYVDSIAIWLKAGSFGSSKTRFIAARLEENATHVKIDANGGMARFIGCVFTGTTTHGVFTIANGGGYNLFNGCTIDALSVVTDSCTGAAISKFVDCVNYVTHNKGTTGAIADGAAITHGLHATALGAVATGSVASEFVSVTILDTDHFHVAIKKDTGAAGTNQVVYWEAWCN